MKVNLSRHDPKINVEIQTSKKNSKSSLSPSEVNIHPFNDRKPQEMLAGDDPIGKIARIKQMEQIGKSFSNSNECIMKTYELHSEG